MTNTQERGLDWQFASGLLSGTMAASGSNQSPGKDPNSSSRSRLEGEEGPQRRRHVLIVEDNKGDVFLIRESMQTVHLDDTEVHVVHDGDKAVRFFEEADRTPEAPVPDLVILDINLPKRQGREVIAEMRQTRCCANTKVLVVTSSDSDQDREDMRRLGVEAYFRKPSDYEGFMKLGEVVNGLLQRGPQTESS